jgi:hypothetical protein
MSTPAAPADPTGTPPATGAAPPQGTDAGSPGTGTTAEDQESAGLLSGMLANDPEALAAELDKWKKEARKWEGRAKTNTEAADKLKQIEDANKTELEKAVEAQRQAEEARDSALATHARVMAAAAHNLPVELIDHLGSGTDQEINDRAELIAKAITDRANAIAEQLVTERLAGTGRNGQQMGARPIESLRPGSQPSSGGTPTTTDEWFRNLLNQGRGQ